MTPACRVGIADDAPDVRMLLRTVLEEEGFSIVGEARNGSEAVDLAREERPDVLLLDLSMPVMDGLEALPLVVEASPETAVVILSGFVNPEVSEKVTTLGAAACIEKGINLAGLVEAVKDLCPAASNAATRRAQTTQSDPVRSEKAAAPPSRTVTGPTTPTARASTSDHTPVLDADDLVPVLLHELNPAVSVLRRSLDVATAFVEQGDTLAARAPLDAAVRALESVSGLLDAFTQVRAADAGGLQLHAEPVAIAATVRQLVADLAPLTADRHVVVDADERVVALVDVERLRQVLANLLSNAAKFSRPDSRIEVGVGSEGDQAVISVRDHGKGIAPQATEVVFRKYSRLGDAPGMGLGLYIARAIVQAHDGDITVESPSDGGARFVVRLPLAPPSPVAEASDQSSARS